MKKKSLLVVMRMRDRLQNALCDQTCDLARYLRDIESAELESRETTSKGLIRCVHHWRARVIVPSILAPHVDGGFLEWTVQIERQANEYVSRWFVEPRFMKGSVLCEATMSLAPAIGGRGTRVELELDVLRDNGSVGFQNIANRILTTQFRKIVEASVRLVDEK